MTTNSTDKEEAPVPERIWMAADTPFESLATWEKKISDSDIEYVRADLASVTQDGLTVEDALKELRAMFPHLYVSIKHYWSHADSVPGLWYLIGVESAGNWKAQTLSDCMARVRAAQQEKGNG